MKLQMLDRFGHRTIMMIADLTEPVLTDIKGRPLIDFGNKFPQPYARPYDGGLHVVMMNSFLMRPSPGFPWMRFPEDNPLYDTYFESLQRALYILTGKKLEQVISSSDTAASQISGHPPVQR